MLRRLLRRTKLVSNGETGTSEMHWSPLARVGSAILMAIGPALAAQAFVMWRTHATLVQGQAYQQAEISQIAQDLKDHIAWSQAVLPTLMTVREADAARALQDKVLEESLRNIQRELDYLSRGQAYNRSVLEKLPVKEH